MLREKKHSEENYDGGFNACKHFRAVVKENRRLVNPLILSVSPDYRLATKSYTMSY